MKKIWKKIISVLLVIAMVTGGIFLPERSVYADDMKTDGTSGSAGDSSYGGRGIALYCAGGYRIYLAKNHMMNEDTHTISASHTYLSQYSSYAYYWFPEKDEYGVTVPVKKIRQVYEGSLYNIRPGMIEQGDTGTFSEITGNTQGFSTWFKATGSVYKNDTASQFRDAMNNTFAGEGKQDNIKNFLDKYKTQLITSGYKEEDISIWFPKNLDDFYANWFIVVEPVLVTYLKTKEDGSKVNYTVFSAQEFFSKNSALGEELTGLSDRADITKIARLMLSASFVNNTTAKGNVYCTYDKEDGTYSKAQAEVDAAEKSIKNVDSPNAGFGLYGGIFSPDRKAGQPSNIGMTVTYDINGSRIGSSVTTEGNITQEEREA